VNKATFLEAVFRYLRPMLKSISDFSADVLILAQNQFVSILETFAFPDASDKFSQNYVI